MPYTFGDWVGFGCPCPCECQNDLVDKRSDVWYFQSSIPQVSFLKSIRCDREIARETSALKSVTLAELHIDTQSTIQIDSPTPAGLKFLKTIRCWIFSPAMFSNISPWYLQPEHCHLSYLPLTEWQFVLRRRNRKSAQVSRLMMNCVFTCWTLNLLMGMNSMAVMYHLHLHLWLSDASWRWLR